MYGSPAPTTYGAPTPGPTTYGAPAPGGYGGPGTPQPYGGQTAPAPGTYGSAPGTYGTPYESGRPQGGTYGSGGGYGGGHDYDRPDPGQRQVEDDRPPVAPVQKRPRKGLTVALALVAAVVVAAVGVFVGTRLLNSKTDYSVGVCVQQNGAAAVVVDCTASGAYKIVSIEDSQDKCEDVQQPWLVVKDAAGNQSYRCLVPANQ